VDRNWNDNNNDDDDVDVDGDNHDQMGWTINKIHVYLTYGNDCDEDKTWFE